MSVLSSLLLKEKIRNKNMIEEYIHEINMLPKGSIKKKNVKNKSYYYLIFRDNNKIVTKYIGKTEESLETIKEQLIRRAQIENMIRKLKEEKKQIERMEAFL